MTKEERRKYDKFEAENRILREQSERLVGIYAGNLKEIATLKVKVEAMTSLINELNIIATEE